MHSFYINEKGQIFKVINENSGIYYELNREESALFMSKVIKTDIKGVSINNGSVYLTYENDTIRVKEDFLKRDNEFTRGIRSKLEKAKKAKEEVNIKAYKAKLNGYIPHINRNRGKKMGALIVASALALELTVPVALAIFRKNIGQEIEQDAIFSTSTFINNSMKPSLENFLSYKNEIEDSAINVELAFEDWTKNAINRAGESQVEVVTRNCAPYADQFIERYGLPREITYAIGTLEKGILDNGNIENPMRINSSTSGEYFKDIPVYENGVPTGEYDSFYVFSQGDPRIAEHPNDKILIIENTQDNFQIGCALFRRCIDRYKNIFIAIDAYNKGLYAFSILFDQDLIEVPNTREYYQENFNDFSWTPLINEYFKVKNHKEDDPNYVYGDPNYIWNVLKHVDMGDSSSVLISYYYKGELINVNLTNTNKLDNSLDSDYNNNLGRG